MCGIFGWAALDARSENRGLLERLTDRLFHRGPDGSGFFETRTANGAHRIALGHRRL